ncbi:hypothetical protein AWZ03_003652 [Drosophila navojoa]|uniref:Uncharacterized protein n=1 Tax=Drosophila navojoa TaxID=7232 RepID=A0A484BLY8_DRONA|nr:hypothetical protein AWZ03_003652 [Drosophila navojoa]
MPGAAISYALALRLAQRSQAVTHMDIQSQQQQQQQPPQQQQQQQAATTSSLDFATNQVKQQADAAASTASATATAIAAVPAYAATQSKQ